MAHSELYKRIMRSKQWKLTRLEYLRQHPCCERCEAQGYVVAAQCVHHITPIETGHTERDCLTLALASSNLQALCYDCHAEIHREERSHSREAHQQREQSRLEQWKDRMRGRTAKNCTILPKFGENVKIANEGRGCLFSGGVPHIGNPLALPSVDA